MEVVERARLSGGSSDAAIYRMVAREIAARHTGGGLLVDVGCGTGNLFSHVGHHFSRYVGVDAVRYPGFPAEGEFLHADLLQNCVALPTGVADVVAAVETIEHLENPRAFARELVRLTRPGGWVIITTPNQLSLHSKLCLLFKQRFAAFQDVHYPAHLSALLEIDLLRIAAESGLQAAAIRYSESGRVTLTSRHYPRLASRLFARALSDNLLAVGRKP